MKNYLRHIVLLCAALAVAACNKDGVVTRDIPVITLDSDTGIYTVKAGQQLTISPTAENAAQASFAWTLDGEVVCRTLTYTATWDIAGDYYPSLTVTTDSGKATEEVRVVVTELTPPVVSLIEPSKGLMTLPSTPLTLAPSYLYDDLGTFSVQWLREDKVVGTERSYTFSEQQPGSYSVTLRATNDDGTTERTYRIEVVASLPYEVSFPARSYFDTSTDRTTLAGRPVYLAPRTEYFRSPQYTWKIDDMQQASHEAVLRHVPLTEGEHLITVTVTEGSAPEALSKHVTRAAASATASVRVRCIAKTEDEIRRSGGSSKYQQQVYEWVPAPGQFIGEKGIGGMTDGETTPAAANAWAKKRLAEQSFVSLGAFGGYLVVGFDHSIPARSSGYDFAIHGNALDASSEPGIVWVMQDTNQNGLPDDEWFELAGNETGKPTTLQHYSVTYYKPEAAKMNVAWTDSEGNSGQIDYMATFHKQDYYYPAWIPERTYTLTGTRLGARNIQDPVTGEWDNRPYDWGYADNYGQDNIGSVNAPSTGFSISKAVWPDGTPAQLKFIDFIKVQTGVNAKSGRLGEVSTEVCAFEDLSAN